MFYIDTDPFFYRLIPEFALPTFNATVAVLMAWYVVNHSKYFLAIKHLLTLAALAMVLASCLRPWLSRLCNIWPRAREMGRWRRAARRFGDYPNGR